MSNAMVQARQGLRSIPTATLEAMLADNVAEYQRFRATGVPCYNPDFDRNCTVFLILSDALEERGISVSTNTGPIPVLSKRATVAAA